jgi:hypothetical protein
MSKFAIERIACPSCNTTSTVRIYDAIDTNDVAARKKVLDGSLFTWKCSKCDYSTNIAFNLLYKDEDHRFMVYCAADGDVDGMRKAMDDIEKNANSLSPSKYIRYSMKRRIVSTGNELREKVFIFEAGLDDRVIELMKCFYMSAVIENQKDLKIVACLFAIAPKDQWAFEFITADGRAFSTPIKKDLYDAFKKEYEEHFGDENDYFVNSEYALDLYNKHAESMTGEN